MSQRKSGAAVLSFAISVKRFATLTAITSLQSAMQIIVYLKLGESWAVSIIFSPLLCSFLSFCLACYGKRGKRPASDSLLLPQGLGVNT